MREAVGGSLLLYILIPVLFIFIVFMAFIMNYAATYRAANYVVTQIETCNANIAKCKHLNNTSIAELVKQKYNYTDGIRYSCTNNEKGSVYRVTLTIGFELPFIGKIGVYQINSETKTIYNVTCNMSTGMNLKVLAN